MELVIYGAGGFARELAWLAEKCPASDGLNYHAVCFVDDNREYWDSIVNGLPVMSLEAARQRFPEAALASGIGAPRSRQATVEKARAAGFAMATIIHPLVEYSQSVEIGEGSVLCGGSILTTNISLGQHVQVNLNCTLGHDAILGDYSTLAPGVHVSGWVHLGKRVYVGTGAVFINGTKDTPLTIGDDAIIGAGACVTRPVAQGTTVVGVPAVPLKRHD